MMVMVIMMMVTIIMITDAFQLWEFIDISIMIFIKKQVNGTIFMCIYNTCLSSQFTSNLTLYAPLDID